MRRKTLILLLSPLLAMATATAARADDQYANATRLYNSYCVQCHGVNRDGNGVNSRDMAVKPRDHTDTKAMGDTPDETLLKAIKGGGLAVGKSVLMPKWEGVLTEDEMKEMVSYLRFVSKTK
ncbi:cytochrome c oxidase cbb3-type subunit 3 [Cupriavidus sp. YR651]|uniref:c-type cytochrome n=1 Tax=Cupriavidus sp. YR651 TaxID=1855315 RepID=UPI00087F3FF0|nr:cytochrome c [Cupriavidus sp. YR651]SDC54655.1 cytochrome c oxidase cbb3-type subunit 3 [Cupriavidus sp. YR651]